MRQRRRPAAWSGSPSLDSREHTYSSLPAPVCNHVRSLVHAVMRSTQHRMPTALKAVRHALRRSALDARAVSQQQNPDGKAQQRVSPLKNSCRRSLGPVSPRLPRSLRRLAGRRTAPERQFLAFSTGREVLRTKRNVALASYGGVAARRARPAACSIAQRP